MIPQDCGFDACNFCSDWFILAQRCAGAVPGMALCPYNLLQTAIVPKLLDESSCFFCYEGFFPPILHCVVMQLIRFQLTKRRAFIYDS